MAYNWYVIHTFSSQEEKIKKLIEKEKDRWSNGHLVRQIKVPMVEMAEQRGGKKRIVRKKLIPRYIFLEIDLDDDILLKIRRIPGVMGFVSSGLEPKIMTEEEISSIFTEESISEDSVATTEKKDLQEDKAIVRILFNEGESVKIIDGPFTNFQGVVQKIIPSTGEVHINIEIFGKSTPVTLDYLQIEKI